MDAEDATAVFERALARGVPIAPAALAGPLPAWARLATALALILALTMACRKPLAATMRSVLHRIRLGPYAEVAPCARARAWLPSCSSPPAEDGALARMEKEDAQALKHSLEHGLD